ncbi:hypothetical protein HGP28_17335 [Vibrio sp. SM6]|uniref:Uncharacterized protein n=1 Tax=Vibrio agarilyticus TaxID=2726741 RepID=A0A7X8TTQ6_9VIBR|nr:hypothetical protein [Vibrio agarilyticus]NLS14625.1 hypothetical protein [Vibrio agarilyticus]
MKNSRAKSILLSLILCVSSGVLAANVEKQIRIKGHNYALPSAELRIVNDRATFSFYKGQGADFVALYNLNRLSANTLVRYAKKSREVFESMKSNGRCPDGDLSAHIGSISSRMGSDKAQFNVVCVNNDITVQAVMTDEYVVNYVSTNFEVFQFERWADDINSKMIKYNK